MVGQGNGLKIQLVRLDLAPPEAELFVKFRKYQTVFQKLVDMGVFDMRAGSFTCHYDDDGILRKIDKHEILFRQ